MSCLGALPTETQQQHQELCQDGSVSGAWIARQDDPTLCPGADLATLNAEIMTHNVLTGRTTQGYVETQANHEYHVTLLHPWVRNCPSTQRLGRISTLLHLTKVLSDMSPTRRRSFSHLTIPWQRHWLRRRLRTCAIQLTLSMCGTVVMIMAQRFFRDSRRFCFNGRGMDACVRVAEGRDVSVSQPAVNEMRS